VKAKELWWMNQEFSPVDKQQPLVAVVQRKPHVSKAGSASVIR
jgi:hypothetical protein